MNYIKERQELCDVAKLLFDRKLTNIAGGNISTKISENVYLITPSLMSEEKYCRITADEILVVDIEGNVIEGNGKMSRESNMHLGIYKNIDGVGCVLHAHPKEILVYSCLADKLPSLTEGTDGYGDVITLPWAKSCSIELAHTAVNYLKTRESEVKQHAVAALLRKHGIIIMDKNLKKAVNALERLEYNAYVNLHLNSFYNVQ